MKRKAGHLRRQWGLAQGWGSGCEPQGKLQVPRSAAWEEPGREQASGAGSALHPLHRAQRLGQPLSVPPEESCHSARRPCLPWERWGCGGLSKPPSLGTMLDTHHLKEESLFQVTVTMWPVVSRIQGEIYMVEGHSEESCSRHGRWAAESPPTVTPLPTRAPSEQQSDLHTPAFNPFPKAHL